MKADLANMELYELKEALRAWASQYTDKEIPEADLEKVAEQILGKISLDKRNSVCYKCSNETLFRAPIFENKF